MKKLFVLLFCFWSLLAAAQNLPTSTEQQLESLNEATEDETEDDTFLQQLQYFRLHPLNLNTVTAADLEELRLLTPLQIESLLRYRKLFQNLIAVHELQAVPYWDLLTIRKVLPYVTVRSASVVGSRFTEGDHLFLLRNTRLLEKQKGFDTSLPTHFSGDRNHVLARYKYQYKNQLQYGVTAEKDAGELFFKNGHSFDFYSAHFFARRIGIIKAIAIGDFTANLGQGLIHWQALAFKKSAEPLAVIRQAPTLLPYSGAGEFYFHRGAGITLQKGPWETTVFASRRKLGANLVTDVAEPYFTSFSTTGLHRTASEQEDQNSIRQLAYGGSVSYHHTRFGISLNGVGYNFSNPLHKRPEPYNRYAIDGDAWHNLSTSYHAVFKNMYLFGEAAVDARGYGAFVNGLLASLDPKVDLTVVRRDMAPQYQALYGNAFTEGTAPTNERGLYIGLILRPTARWRLNSYADFFKSPWLRYRVDAPSTGQDYLLQLTFQPRKTLELYARYRCEQKVLNALSEDSLLHEAVPATRQNLRVNMVYTPVRGISISIKARTEAVWYQHKNAGIETGVLCYVETGYGLLKKLRGNVRLQYFNTGSYDTRIYAYESDVLYSYSVPPFFNTGFRYYFNLQYDVFRHCSLWLRWAQSHYKNGQAPGTGLTSVSGNTLSEFKCQASYRF